MDRGVSSMPYGRWIRKRGMVVLEKCVCIFY